MLRRKIQAIFGFLTALMLVLIVGCSDDDKGTEPDPATAPVVTTSAVSGITQTTAQCGGNVTSDGGAAVTARGVCWSANATPTTADNISTDGTGTGSFTSSLTDLTAATSYYVRAYATNSAGTAYGEERSFTTESQGGPDSTGTVTDIDGNIYQTIKIGDQWWMAENLKVTHYRNGDPIPHVTDAGTWEGLSTDAYCNYNNDEANVATYGRLYNGYAVDDSRGIAPEGWHVPTDEEWKQLEMYLGMSQAQADGSGWRGTDEGGKLKDTGTTHWVSPNTGATNESGFSALPGGYRGGDGYFYGMGDSGDFWSSTEGGSYGAWAWDRSLDYNTSQVVRRYGYYKPNGFSVRCVRDTQEPQLGAIIIDPSPDSVNAPWSLDGPNSYTTSGNGDATLQDLKPGDYAITWGEVTGWTTPPNSTQTLQADQTITFSGTYTEESDSTGTVTDYDGNVYQTTKIGDQWWMMENLKVTHYRNGDPIPHVTDDSTWSGLTTGAYCAYNNDENNVATYGRLYNWYAVDDGRNLAPEGWHVPTDEEWKQLETSLGMTQAEADATNWRGTDEGGKLKEVGTTHWNSPNTGATNESGFTALPGGVRWHSGGYDYMGDFAYFWSSSEDDIPYAWYRFLSYDYSQVFRSIRHKAFGFSVRCIRD